jgi:hypothetical protein
LIIRATKSQRLIATTLGWEDKIKETKNQQKGIFVSLRKKKVDDFIRL